MTPPEPRTDFPIEIDVHQATLSPGQTDRMRDAAGSLARQVEHFPVASMHVLIEHNARTKDHTVKTDLFLSGATLVCSETDPQPYTAFERCLARLTDELEAYKNRLGQDAERQKVEKGTHQPMLPTTVPDLAAVGAAVRDQDYPAFYMAMLPFEDAVRRRAGRWLERYPEAEAQIGRRWDIGDLVEEVFLNAFESYDHRPQTEGVGEWLERLIDPAVKGLMSKSDDELENVRMARASRAAEQGAEAL